MTILLTLDNLTTFSTFTNHAAGIYKIPISISESFEFGFGDFWGTETYNTQVYDIENVEVDYTPINKVGTLTECEATTETFFYNKSTYTLYINYGNPYYLYQTDVGLGLTYCKTNNPAGYVSDLGVFYEPRLERVPNIIYQKDDFIKTVPKNESVTITLANDESLDNLDNIANLDLYGNPAKIKLATSETPNDDDFTTVFSGRIDDIPNVGLDSVTFRLNNQRKFLKVPIASRTFNDTDFPDIDDDTKGQNIPIVLGQARNVPAICVNKDESTSVYTFKVCDTDPTADYHFDISAINAVRVNGVTVTPAGVDLVNATFNLTSAQCKDGDSFLDVTADVDGWEDSGGTLIENSLDLIKTLIEVYANIPYIASRYDLTQWAASTASAHDVSYWTDGAQLRDFITLAAQSELGVFTDQPDGLFRFYFSDLTASATATIKQSEQFNLPTAKPTVDRVKSSVAVGYNREWNTGKSRQVIDDSIEDTVFQRFRFKERLSSDTLLISETDATSYATDLLSRLNEKPIFEISVPLSEYFDLFITSIVNIEINRVMREWYGTIKAEIEKVQINADNETVLLTLKYIEET